MDVRPLTSESPIRVSYRRATVITLLTLVVAQAVTAIAIWICDFPPEILDEVIFVWFTVAAICPVVIAFPLAVILQRERLKLARAMRQLEAAHVELSQRSRLDPLTGLLNRDAFLAEVRAAQDDETAGAILMIDIDRFKQINDTYGHQEGDEALCKVARAIRSAVREGDSVGRIGGEEFAVFAPGRQVQVARLLAERIRLAISSIRFEPETGKSHTITASIGVAQGEPDSPVSGLLSRADQSMYAAKQSGRNRVQVHTAA